MTTIDDFRWLTEDKSRELLVSVSTELTTPVVVSRLRKQLSQSQVHLLCEQIDLRRRARAKFSRADEMFFTRTLLEQATDERTAAVKAHRFADGHDIADLCCGIGGDLIALSRCTSTVAIDRDPVATLFAEINTQVHGGTLSSVQTVDAENASLASGCLLHIDPDRRAKGTRTTHLDYFSPDRETLQRLIENAAGAAVKLAPATVIPEEWRLRCDREWFGCGGECRQQVAWFGELADNPGARKATIVDARGGEPVTVVGQDHRESAEVDVAGAYIFEPHPTVLAAGLGNSLAKQCGLHAVASGVAYYSGNQCVDHPALARFRIHDVLPLDERQLRGYLRSRDIGRLEIKKRNIDIDPELFRNRLRLSGDNTATLILYRDSCGGRAVLAERIAEGNGDDSSLGC